MEPRSEVGPQAVDRVLRVLLAFCSAGHELGISELSREVGLGKSVVHRILGGLMVFDFVTQDPKTSRYRLGPGATQLGLSALGSLDLLGIARPVMERLREETRETVTVSIKVGDHRTYAAQVESPQDIRMRVEVGRSFPLYAGASGRAILAHLPPEELAHYLDVTPIVSLTPGTINSREALVEELQHVRQRGYAASAGERDPLAAAVAAPLRSLDGDVIGAISVCGPVPRFTPDRVFVIGESVRDAAAQVSAAMGYRMRSGEA